MSPTRIGSSFRDPSGFLFTRDGVLLRQVQERYRTHYEKLKSSGLYDTLVREGLLVPHDERPVAEAALEGAAFVLKPERIPFISLPYEWCFAQRKAAALTTLRIQEIALAHGMTLKDATAFNIQFRGVEPVLIDTLSFETYVEGAPWVAYRQFCQHFLVPLLLMSRVDVRCGGLLRQYIDGIPLDLGSALLPRTSWLHFGTLLHVHAHARAQRRFAEASVTEVAGGRRISRDALLRLLQQLESTVRSLSWSAAGTQWADYETDNSYNDAAQRSKIENVGAFLSRLEADVVWDLGANTGTYSRVAAERGAYVVSADIDPAAVERNYRRARDARDRRIHPLLLDLTNPTPAQGWAHRERLSLEDRGPADAVLALALVHHLAIANNVPLDSVARYFARLGRALIIEFVPKEDVQVQRLLRNREDVMPGYTREGFERSFERHFALLESKPVQDSPRTLYLMVRRNGEAG
jgi:SAM-dependent methyltransferase